MGGRASIGSVRSTDEPRIKTVMVTCGEYKWLVCGFALWVVRVTAIYRFFLWLFDPPSGMSGVAFCYGVVLIMQKRPRDPAPRLLGVH